MPFYLVVFSMIIFRRSIIIAYVIEYKVILGLLFLADQTGPRRAE